MLVKYGDRLTIDGALALQFEGGLQNLLDFVRGQRRFPDQLPFPSSASAALRFLRYNGQGVEAMTESDVRKEISGPIRVGNVLADQRESKDILDKFLTSKAHHQLAFVPDPLVFGTLGRYFFAAGEGQSGRKFKRSAAELVEFLRENPQAEGLYSDLEMRLMFEQEIKTAEELRRFLGTDLSRLDFVMDAVAMLSGHLFESSAPEIAAKKDWILELNPNSTATIDFRFYDAPAHSFPHTGFAQATKRLAEALTEICTFAKHNNIEEEAKSFTNALMILQGPAVERGEMWKGFSRAHEGHSVEEAYRLFRSAVFADNFAGMGSWNDVQIEETDELHRVSNAVALSLLEALCASVDGLQ